MVVHTLSLTQTSPYPSGHFKCNLCWEKGSGPLYHCAHCEFSLHVSCAATGKQQTHFTHYEHPLHLCYCSTGHVCDGCDKHIQTWAFRCDMCDFDIHSLCVRAPRFILHPSHPHPLALFKSSEIDSGQCDGCKGHMAKAVYRCRMCNYDLHQFCATLPLKTNHPKHPEHALSLLFEPPNATNTFTCGVCQEQGKGWLFHCAKCRFNLHPGCAKISHELPHASFAHEGSNVAVPSAAPSVLLNSSSAPLCSTNDLDAVERVLCFAREMLKGSSSHATQQSSRSLEDDEGICPTCLEGYDPGNPKRSTSCGHHFHLACILGWMERSTHCPICRKNVNILM